MYEIFGKLEPLMQNPSITEIMVNGTQNIFIEKEGKKIQAELKFSSIEEVASLIKEIFNFLGARIDEQFPCADACLEDGTRINAVLPPISRIGPSITIRKFSAQIKNLEDLVERGTLTQKMAQFLIACVKGKLNILFSGATGSGKTTLLKLLCQYIEPQERIIIIEDAPEIHLKHPNMVPLMTRLPDEEGRGGVGLRDLIRNALRMRPERIVLGEIRGSEALDILQAMSTGHRGTMAVIHGNNPIQTISRLETLVRFSGLEIPSEEVKKLIASTINIIVQLEQFSDGSRKARFISEVRGVERGQVQVQNIYTFIPKGRDKDGRLTGNFRTTFAAYPLFFQEFKRQGLLSEEVFLGGYDA